MRKNQGMPSSKMLFAAILMSLFFVGTSQAQTALTAFTGKFTLTNQVQWDKTILQPGDYAIAIESSSMPTFALLTDSKGRVVARFVSVIDGGQRGFGNALLLHEKGGQPHVYALALAGLGRFLVYDPAFAREAVMEARSPQTVPVILAKR